jgi:hypothetical protein
MTREVIIPRVSDRLQKVFDEIRTVYDEWYGRSKKLIQEAYRIATEEDHYTPKEAYALMRKELTEICSPQTLRQYVPDEAKDMTKARDKEQSSGIISANTAQKSLEHSSSESQSEFEQITALQEGLKIVSEQNEQLQEKLKFALDLEDEQIDFLILLLQRAFDSDEYRDSRQMINQILAKLEVNVKPVYSQEEINLK